jgi:hypothetical protein
LVGSSLSTRVTAIVSSRSLNHPLGRYQVLVWVGDGGILKNVAIPISRVIKPLCFDKLPVIILVNHSTRSLHLLDQEEPSDGMIYIRQIHVWFQKTYRQPALPRIPRIWSTPKAMKLAIMLQIFDEIQNKARRRGSSFLV